MLSKNTPYIGRLDHLRFFAALLVVAYHWHATDLLKQPSSGFFMSLIREGEIGVSLFMVLSGFILTRISLGKQIDYKAFVYNRFIRIYPLYAFVIVVDAFTYNRPVEFLTFVQLLSPFANLHSGYPFKFPQMWTIPVEFQFYLIFPFVAAFLARFGVRYIVGLIGLAILIRTMVFFNDGFVRDAAYWTILGRIDQFAVGMLAAVLYRKREGLLSSPLFVPLTAAGVLLWVHGFERWTGGYYGADSAASSGWIVTPTVEAIVWAAFSLSYLQQRWSMPAVVDKTLAYLGTTSFSMYAWHWPIQILLKKYPALVPFESWYFGFLLVDLPLVIAMSSFSYYMIEKPFFSLRTVYAKNPALAPVENVDMRPVRISEAARR